MLILVIRTDKPDAELGLYADDKKVAYTTWQAHRALAETIHSKLQELLATAKKDQKQIKGIVVFKGPGSFTGLRIGVSVANALAYGLNISIVSEGGTDWIDQGIKHLQAGQNEGSALPEYGAPVHITQQRK